MYKSAAIITGLFCYFAIAYSFVLGALNGQSGFLI